MREWLISDARAHFNELLNAARDEPQAIAEAGRVVAVVLSEPEYERLCGPAGSLSQFFARSGLGDVEVDRVQAAPRDEAEL
jgi:prevent-host-death family protein